VKWPSDIPIYGYSIPITCTTDMDDDLYGEFTHDGNNPEIKVQAFPGGGFQDDSIAHEVIHAWLWATGLIELKEIKAYEEIICKSFAPLLVQLVKEFYNE